MGTAPPPFVRFRSAGEPCDDRIPVYRLALALSAKLFALVELSAEVERYYLRDQLDKKSTAVPVLVARALDTAAMPERRVLLRLARKAVSDCFAILDVLAERRTIEGDAVPAARDAARALIAELDALTVEPPMQR